MKMVLLSVFMFIFGKDLYAENNWIIKGGFNCSELQGIESKPQYNYSIGIERKIPIWSFFSISPEVLWSKQGCTIQNKPVWTDTFTEALYRHDINIIRTSFDLSLVLDFLLFQQKDISFSIRSFPSFHLENYNLTNIQRLGEIKKDEGNIDWENYDFEFRQGDYEHLFNNIRTGWTLTLSFCFKYKILVTEIRYMNNLSKIGQAGQLLPIKYRIHSFHFLFGIIF